MESKPSLDLLYELYSAFAPRASDTTSTPGSGYRSLTFSSVAPNSNTEKAAAKPIATAGVSITASFPKPLKLAPLVTEKNGKPQSLLFGGSTQHDRFVQEGAVRQVTFPTKTVRDGASVELIPVMNHPVIKTLVEELTKHEISSVSDIVVLYGQKLRADDQGMSRNPTAFLVSAFNLPNREFRLLSLDVKKSTTSWYPSGEKYIDMHVDEDKTLHAATIYQRRLHSLKLDNHLVPQEESLRVILPHLKHFIQGCADITSGIVQHAGRYAYSVENNLVNNQWEAFMTNTKTKEVSKLAEYKLGRKLTSLLVVAQNLYTLDEYGILSVIPLNEDGSVQPHGTTKRVFLGEAAQREFEAYYSGQERMMFMRMTPVGYNRLEGTNQLLFVSRPTQVIALDARDLSIVDTINCEKHFRQQRENEELEVFGIITGLKVLSLPKQNISLLAVFFSVNWVLLFNINSVVAWQQTSGMQEESFTKKGGPLTFLDKKKFFSSQIYNAKVLRNRTSDLVMFYGRNNYTEHETYVAPHGDWNPVFSRSPLWCVEVKITE